MLALAFRPESWNGLLFVHILAGAAIVGGVLVSTVAGIAAARRDSPREIYLLTRIGYRVDLFLTWPAFIVLFVVGAVLAGREDVWSDAWLQAGIGLTIAGAVLGGFVLAGLTHRVMRRARELVAEGVEHSDELQRMANHPLFRILGPPVLAILVTLLAVMTMKP